jgi:hypothetical protein|tara:strand:+ start:13 stop:201 length:189 start_codon:yes stop_codon:yes gene_type:complete
MTATEEALAAMAKAEEAWNKMVDERVQVSGQFVEDCKEFQKECREAFADVPEQPKQDPRLLA